MTTREEQEKKEKAEKAYALTNDTRTVAGENMQHTLGAYAGLVQDDEEDRIYTPEEIERAREIGDAAILRADRKSRASYRSRKQQEAANEQQVTEEEGGIERQRANERQHALTQRMLQKQTIQKSIKASAALATKGVVSKFGTTMSISASVVSYKLQFLFALLALVFFGASAAVGSIYDVAIIGTILKAATKVISVFVDLEKYAPLVSFAFIFWGLSAIVAFSTYFAHCLLFSQLEREVAFGSAPMMGCAALTFALAIVPILNILPWVQMWVVLITIRSSYRIVKEAIT